MGVVVWCGCTVIQNLEDVFLVQDQILSSHKHGETRSICGSETSDQQRVASVFITGPDSRFLGIQVPISCNSCCLTG
jgi:hypothetical protein